MEHTYIHLAGGKKEHDFKIPLSYHSPNQGLGLDKADMRFREYLLIFNFNRTHIGELRCPLRIVSKASNLYLTFTAQ